jgi:integrase
LKIQAFIGVLDYNIGMEIETQSLILTPYENFLYAMKAQETKRQYPHRLDKFLTFMNLQGTIQEKCARLYETANKNINLFQSNIIRFINFQKERIGRGEISEGTLCNYVKALKLFCNMNDIVINWKKIGKGMPSEKHNAEDRIPTKYEIRKLLEHPDRRIKPIVCVMISSGIRIGSWDYLKWKHVVPIKDNDTVIAARISIRNTKINNREYYSFITPEAYHSLKDWMEFRQLHGEEVDGNSWLMRDVWQKTDKSITTANIQNTYLIELENNGFIDKQDSAIDKRQKIYFPIMDISKDEKIEKLFNEDSVNNFLQPNKITPSKYFKKIPENWLELEISDLKNYLVENDKFQVIDENDDEISIPEFVKNYSKELNLTKFFVDPEFSNNYSEIMEVMKLLYGNKPE